jgi:hypothetical protein
MLPRRSDAFVRGSDQALWTVAVMSGVCGEWNSLGKPAGMNLIGNPTAISRAPGRLEVYVRARDSSLWTRQWTGVVWTDWTMVGTGLDNDATATLSGRGTEIFAPGSAGLSNIHWHSIGALWKAPSADPDL